MEGRGGRAQDSYPGNSRRLLRLGHRPAYRECEREGDKPSPFWIFDFGFLIVGSKHPSCFSNHPYHVRIPQSKIVNPKLFYDPIRPRQHTRWDRHADLLRCLQIDDELELRRLLDGQVGGLGAFRES